MFPAKPLVVGRSPAFAAKLFAGTYEEKREQPFLDFGGRQEWITYTLVSLGIRDIGLG